MRRIQEMEEEELKRGDMSPNSSNLVRRAEVFDEGDPVHAGFLEDFMQEKKPEPVSSHQ